MLQSNNPFSRERYNRQYRNEYIALTIYLVLFTIGCIIALILFIQHTFFDFDRKEELGHLAVVLFPLIMVFMIFDRRLSREDVLRDELAHTRFLLTHLLERNQDTDSNNEPANRPGKT